MLRSRPRRGAMVVSVFKTISGVSEYIYRVLEVNATKTNKHEKHKTNKKHEKLLINPINGLRYQLFNKSNSWYFDLLADV